MESSSSTDTYNAFKKAFSSDTPPPTAYITRQPAPRGYVSVEPQSNGFVSANSSSAGFEKKVPNLEQLLLANGKMAIGNLDELPKKVFQELNDVIDKTKNNTRMNLTLALSYGARDEIINAVKDICNNVKKNLISPEIIDEYIINQHLYTRNLPDVDLLIRTSGEQRISNFLLWQIAYAELYFTEVLWPDFSKEELYKAIADYQNRERRFGKTSEQLS